MLKRISDRSTHVKMLLALSMVSALCILPFAIYRIVQKDWNIATINIVVVIGMLLIFSYVYITDKTKNASIVLVLIAFLANVLSFYIKGMSQVFWIYPALLISYYVMVPRAALFVNFSIFSLYIPKILSLEDLVSISTIVITILISNLVAYFFAAGLKKQEEILTELATKDYLTEVGNRRALEDHIQEIHKELKNHDKTASLIILDIDHFKQVNDTYGHLKGDKILVELSKFIKKVFKEDSCSVFRYGGEEFLVTCEDLNHSNAYELAEELRENVKENLIVEGCKISISLGVTEYIKEESVDDWIHRVDVALYQAKNDGRDRTVQA